MDNQRPRSPAFRNLTTAMIVVLLLGGAIAMGYWIQQSEPTAEREAATRKSAAPVHTVTARRGTHRPSIHALGVVQPAREIMLAPRVSGEVIAVEPEFRPGGLVSAGAPLIRLDPADYEQAVIMRESELGQVQAELAIEEGQQRVAQLEFELLGADIAPANRSLVLREPQISSLRSKQRAAEASLQQAQLDLTRTSIAAPFDAQILERFVELGSQVAAGVPCARLVGIDEYWVVATVPLGEVHWIQFADAPTGGARATVRHPKAWPLGQQRDGVVERLIGEVDQSTRMARILVSVPRPLGGDGVPPLILGAVVRVEIEAKPIEDVVRLERAYLRQGDSVWVMDGNALRVRQAEVVFSDSSYAYLGSGVNEGDKIITTDLATVVDGLPVRESNSPTDQQASANSEASNEQ